MDENDYRALIELVETQLRDVGAPDITDARHYVSPNAETRDALLLPPKARLIAMLRAFGRLLAVEDRATYDIALTRIRTKRGWSTRRILCPSF